MRFLTPALFGVLMASALLLPGCGGDQDGPPSKEYATDIARGNVKPETGKAAIGVEFSNTSNDTALTNMKVFLLVRDTEGNALFNDEQVTDEFGVAHFKGLPAREAVVRVWNPEEGSCEFEVDLSKYTGEKAGDLVKTCLF